MSNSVNSVAPALATGRSRRIAMGVAAVAIGLMLLAGNGAFSPAESASGGLEPAGPAAKSPDGKGRFRVQCGFSHVSNNDPIVSPRQRGAAHRHYFFGNENTTHMSTAASLRNTGNSTCNGGNRNRSAYWVPALFNTAGNPVAPSQTHFYYKSGSIPAAQIQVFPAGLRMVAGNAKTTVNQSTQRVRWFCTQNARETDRAVGSPVIPSSCPAGKFLQASVMFPQCWNGRNLDSSDHISHMAWPIGNKCPASHPRPLPRINLNFMWRITSGTTQGWTLASDAPGQRGGQSLHADWFDGWDRDTARTFVAHCIRKGLNCKGGNMGNGTKLTRFGLGKRSVGAAAAGAPGKLIAGSPPFMAPNGAFTTAQPVRDGIRVSGWTLDQNSVAPVTVHLFDNGKVVRTLAATYPKSHLRAAFPLHGEKHGFNTIIDADPGTHKICAVTRNIGVGRRFKSLGCKTVTISGQPEGVIGAAIPDTNAVGFWGWASDPDTSNPIQVEVRIDGQVREVILANGAQPSNHAGHGYNGRIENVSPGTHQLCVTARNVGAGSNQSLGCKTFTTT